MSRLRSAPEALGEERWKYQVVLQYHGGDGSVVTARMYVSNSTRWVEVREYVLKESGFVADSLELRDENGGALGAEGPLPLEWVRLDAQERSYRVARASRRGVAGDRTFALADVVAPTHIGLVENVINAGISTATMLSESIENSVQHRAGRVDVVIEPATGRVMIYDDGVGITPEDGDAVAKAGASTVRETATSGVCGALRVEPSSRAVEQLTAKFGRYGIGRFAQFAKRGASFQQLPKGFRVSLLLERERAIYGET